MSSISIGVLLSANTLGVAIARRTLSSHRATRDTAFAQSCGQCPELRMCSAEQDYTTPNDGTWDSGTTVRNQDGIFRFNFTFTATSADVRFIAASVDPSHNQKPNANISYVIDQVNSQVASLAIAPGQCSSVDCKYSELRFTVQELPNQEHTLTGSFSIPPTVLVDCWFYKVDPYGSPMSRTPSAGTAVASSTDATEVKSIPSETSSSTDRQIGSAPSTTLGPLIGGIVSGITVLILIIAGVLWYRFKQNSKRRKLRSPVPFVEELSPSSPPPNPTVMGLTTYDPPGYTEKNAYFGLPSSLENYSALSTSAPEKKPIHP